jgi:hypothetical protein
MRCLVAARLALSCGTAEPLEGFEKERLDIVRLQPASLGPLHFLADLVYARGIHRIMGQRPLFEQAPERLPVEGVVDDPVEPRPDLGLLAVADGIDQEVAQRSPLELQLAEHVEHLAAQRRARLL